MTLPKCQHKGCREASACYLSEKNLYLCQYHRFTRYPNEDSVPLVDDVIIETDLKAIEICRKDFLAYTQMLNEGRIPPDEDDLSTTVRVEFQHISDELKEAQETRKYYKSYELLDKTLKIKNVLQKDSLYVEHLVTRAWNQSLSTVKDESLKSSELVQMELKEKYDAIFDTISKKFREFRNEIKQRHIEELKATEQEKENLKADYDNIKLGLISKLNLSECSYLSLLYKITTGQDKQIGPETGLTLTLNNPKHMEFLTSLNKRMPDIDCLDLDNIPLNCQEVNTFLATHFPNKVRVLHFNFGSSVSSCVSFYLEELVEVSKRVTGQLFIYNFEVPQDQLVSLFSANRHTKYFGLPFCKLSLSSVPGFGGTLAGSTMQGLNLGGCGGSSYGDWGNNESHFENLIAGLSKEEDFRENLKWIGMGKCGMEMNVVKKILVDHGFGHVEIASYWK
ncbi:unnamed protein product [Moneuplotes crassus]|uniref:Uncharacterized protein n=1 Tax=Euplotes crassus TaxID=5936 RepID=A0AAD1UJF4_EUPCR|nr:unnamed protein product [Moneuplotes crassus]